jgi:proteasome lid subunit RPN8/RPN11
VRIARDALHEVHGHASDGYPNEICGALISTGDPELVTQVRRMRNIVVDRARDRYKLDDREQLNLMKECDAAGWRIVGFYHSHPDHPAWASETDAKDSWAGWVYLIVSCVKGNVVDGNAFVTERNGGPMRQIALQVVE